MRNRKATGDDGVPTGLLKLLGEGGLKIMTKKKFRQLVEKIQISLKYKKK